MNTFGQQTTVWLSLAAMQLTSVAQPSLGAASQDALRSAGPQASHVLDLWHLTIWISTIVFTTILVALLWALWRAPRAHADTPADVSGLTQIEHKPRRSVIVATGASIALLLVLLIASVATDRALAHLVLHEAIHIDVTAHQWWWSARYDADEPAHMFTVANELHIPVGKPVIITLHSSDVIHSLWVPNLAGKKDLVPGRTATLMLRADRAGVYRGQCAEFCGAQHAWMAFFIVADTREQYTAWVAKQREPASTPADGLARRGQQVFLGTTCVMCHAIGGTEAGAQSGPDLTHLASRGTLGAGTLPNDAPHLAAWIINPSAHKPGVNMPSHAFSQDDLEALVAYLGGLR